MKAKEWVFKKNKFSLISLKESLSLLEGEVLIKVTAVGICGSDLFAMEVADESITLRLGHEWVGKVIDSNNTRLKIDQNVTSPAILGCGKCTSCTTNKSNLCTKSKTLGGEDFGALRSHIIIHERHLTVLPTCNAASSVLIEVAAVAFEAISKIKILGYTDHKKLLIFGAGPVGLFCALQAKKESLPYKLIELDKFRVSFAKSLGLEVAQTQESLINRANSKHYQYIIDCSGDGNNKSGFWKYFNFFSCINVNLLVVGKYINSPVINSNLFANKSATVQWMRGMPADTIELAYKFWEHEIDDISGRIVTHRFSFDEVDKAFSFAIKRENTVKVLIEV